MDVSNIANVSLVLAQAKTDDAVSVAVLKKSSEIQSEIALQLLQALPSPVTEDNLGNTVNVLA